jgi:hypothetical protein
MGKCFYIIVSSWLSILLREVDIVYTVMIRNDPVKITRRVTSTVV